MLRVIFVSLLIIAGAVVALQGPLNALLFYLWIAYFRPEVWAWNTLRVIPISLVAGAYLLVRSIFSSTAFRVDLRTVLLFAIGVLATVSTLLSSYSGTSLVYLQDFAKTLIITYLIAVLASDTPRLRLTVLVIVLSLSWDGARQGWFTLVLNPGGVNRNEMVNLGDNNGVAVGMLMLVPLIVALARSAASRWERWLHVFLAVGTLYRAVATFSRGGFLAALALGFMFAVRSPRKVRAAVGVALTTLLIVSVLPQTFWDRMDTIDYDEEDVTGAAAAKRAGGGLFTTADTRSADVRSADSRLHFWNVAVAMARDNPFGVGVNGFMEAYDDYDSIHGAYGRRRSVHSVWFGMLAELGFVGLALFISILVLAWLACRRARRLARKGRISEELGHLATGLEAALVVCSVGGTFVIFQYTELLWHTVGLTMAVHFLTTQQLARRAPEVPEMVGSPRRIAV